MSSLVVERRPIRFAAARAISAMGSGRGAGLGPLRLVDGAAPALLGSGWHRVAPLLSGICGSDLATLDGRSSRYFEDIVSFPFVPGHEVVGTVPDGARTADGTALAPGSRVVLEPVLGCLARGIDPMCEECAAGRTGNCRMVAYGHLRPGLQTGFCADTGGGWSEAGLVAHESQLHAVPDAMSDRDAVTVEPVACAVHAVMSAGLLGGETVAVVGAGTLGLAVVAAITRLGARGHLASPSALVVGARYPHQRQWAEDLGATQTLPPEQLSRAIRRRTRSMALGSSHRGRQRINGGAEVVFDCVGTAASIEHSLDLVRPRGKVVLVGMAGRVNVDLASLWHREVTLCGAYAYGTEPAPVPFRTFEAAFDVVSDAHTGRLVSATYPLERFEEAVGHAGSAGSRGAVKIAFELQRPPQRPTPREEDRP
ncbi:MAG: zinc-binding dehydrogenase [Actinomycetota bacterium]|jgi:threonine dehydrogenase-like Zn-dependent dehydrogenase|nr:zinc-binding dehydrogenase [Actinomycetota bacterium]